MSNIDIVVTWVDGTDPEWLAEKMNYNPELSAYKESDIEQRYRPSDLFRFWFRGVEKYAPWVNKIYFVTYGHVPEWLNVEHPKLKIVKHSDYIPKEYLPTYNSNVIELNLHRIPELSERFILFNDDVFLINKVDESDFFDGDKIKVTAIYKPIMPLGNYDHMLLNNVILMNKYFSKRNYMKKNFSKFFRLSYGKHNINNLISLFYPEILGYKDFHITAPHLKSTLALLWEKEPDLLHKVSLQKFRTLERISHLVLHHWNVEMGKFSPQSATFGKYFMSHEIELIKTTLHTQKYNVICINDEDNGFDYADTTEKLWSNFETLLPQPSAFEK